MDSRRDKLHGHAYRVTYSTAPYLAEYFHLQLYLSLDPAPERWILFTQYYVGKKCQDIHSCGDSGGVTVLKTCIFLSGNGQASLAGT